MVFLRCNDMDMPAMFVVGLCCFLLSRIIQVEASDQLYRTSFHFQSPQNWLNDPNGPMLHKGIYHLFYQYNPKGAVFGDKMVWAHSVSCDLINWMHLRHALCPTEPFDINSCWSGSITILPESRPVILYTGIDADNRQVQNLAMPKNLSDPLLTEWIKFSQNPVMTPPQGVDAHNFRDPTTAWQGLDGKWRVIVGSWSNNQGMAILYRSKDFLSWTKSESPIYSTDKTGMWECPDFYPVRINSSEGVDNSILNPNIKHVMKAGFSSHDYYILGTYVPEMDKYTPDTNFTGTTVDLRYDYGKFYGSKTFFDSVNRRRILWAWVNESDSSEDDIRKGWSGLQSIPRQIWLDSGGTQLLQWPVEEINELRGNKVSIAHRKLESESVLEVNGITASQADVEIVFDLPELENAEFLKDPILDPELLCSNANASVKGRFGPFGLLVLAAKDLTEKTAIFFRIFRGKNGYTVLMCSDQSRSSLRDGVDKTTFGALVKIDPRREKVSLRSLIDHSIVESFAGEGRTSITTRVYPTVAVHEGAHLYVFNNGTKSVVVSRLDAWSMSNARIKQYEDSSHQSSCYDALQLVSTTNSVGATDARSNEYNCGGLGDEL
ncbi:hypothetical protein K2173_018125 [Erythroxylum novogranatense]|uniref:Uncharacterized protein n=1 Tax=Erythroxylum novogranatense TaxID=1862640 RepID=A0AAV8U6B4_9ROSI|nr:hypothetical protein K2173_018125 [Erythroxylum novogranatense]